VFHFFHYFCSENVIFKIVAHILLTALKKSLLHQFLHYNKFTVFDCFILDIYNYTQVFRFLANSSEVVHRVVRKCSVCI
jgi:hypothetical protein